MIAAQYADALDGADPQVALVIVLKRDAQPRVVLNNLYKHTQLQDTFGMNMVALIDGQPRLCNLKLLLEIFLEHRREVVTRRTVFELPFHAPMSGAVSGRQRRHGRNPAACAAAAEATNRQFSTFGGRAGHTGRQ